MMAAASENPVQKMIAQFHKKRLFMAENPQLNNILQIAQTQPDLVEAAHPCVVLAHPEPSADNILASGFVNYFNIFENKNLYEAASRKHKLENYHINADAIARLNAESPLTYAENEILFANPALPLEIAIDLEYTQGDFNPFVFISKNLFTDVSMVNENKSFQWDYTALSANLSCAIDDIILSIENGNHAWNIKTLFERPDITQEQFLKIYDIMAKCSFIPGFNSVFRVPALITTEYLPPVLRSKCIFDYNSLFTNPKTKMFLCHLILEREYKSQEKEYGLDNMRRSSRLALAAIANHASGEPPRDINQCAINYLLNPRTTPRHIFKRNGDFRLRAEIFKNELRTNVGSRYINLTTDNLAWYCRNPNITMEFVQNCRSRGFLLNPDIKIPRQNIGLLHDIAHARAVNAAEIDMEDVDLLGD